MPIGKLRRATRYIARYREILGVLIRYGLADWAKRIDIDFAREVLTSRADPDLLRLSTNERIRRALLELGPTFIKFGQTLSVRPDLVGVELANELKKLQSRVPPDLFDIVKVTVELELKAPLTTVFSSFDERPIASASIGQVHKATLLTGEKVAVKIRRQGIEQTIEADLDIIKDLAELVADYIEESRYYRPRETVDRFSRTLMREIDFMREARNIINLGEDLGDDLFMVIPKVYETFTTSKVLTMEWLDGTPLDRLTPKQTAELDLGELAERGAEAYLKMIFVNGFYHADPHPGNLMIMEQGKRFGLLDFGMVGRLSARMREHIEDMVAAIVTKDSERMVRVITRAGEIPPEFNATALGADLTDFISYYGAMPLSKIDISGALNELVSIIHRHHILLASEIVLLVKTLVTLEGTGRQVAVGFNLFSMVAPYQAQMASPAVIVGRKLAKAKRFYDEISEFVEVAPPALLDIIERFRKGTIEIHMEHKKLERSVNRLVFGILTASIFIGSSMVMASGAPPVVFGFSALGVIGYVIALVMGIRILWSIMITDRLD
jgi:ubiquinone biosynthesis protein